MQPRILLTTTTWFATPARAAIAFAKAGARVSAVLPRGNPAEKVSVIERRFHYSPIEPLASIAQAIDSVEPDLIVPCDDRAVEHLHRLHAQYAVSPANANARDMIERSLGRSSEYQIVRSRARFLNLAAKCGVRVPKTAAVHTLTELKLWLRENGLPAVLKVDGTWSGTGVRVVRSWAEAERAYALLTSPMSYLERFRLLCVHDLYPLFSQGSRSKEEITVQEYIEGDSANAMFACWNGRVLDELSVKTLFSVDPLGSSTVVQTMNNAEIASAGNVLVSELGISGFCGLDFITSRQTGEAFLTELNPRITQLGHLEPSGRSSLIATLSHHLAEEPSTASSQTDTNEIIAFFPHVLRCKPDNPLLTAPSIRYDIPWEEPELTKELTRKPWNRRHLSAMLFGTFQKLMDRIRLDWIRRDASREDVEPCNSVDPGEGWVK